jgi:IS5 family transposase
VLEVRCVVRTKEQTEPGERFQEATRSCCPRLGRVVEQAKPLASEITNGVKRSTDVIQQAVLEGLRKELDTIVRLVQQVILQTKQQTFGRGAQFAEKLVSIFEPTTKIIRKAKASKPTEFGKIVNIQEAENQFITAKLWRLHPSSSSAPRPSMSWK